jgi:hypothetical protein
LVFVHAQLLTEIYLITYLIVIQNFPVGIHTFILLLVAVLQFTLVNPSIPGNNVLANTYKMSIFPVCLMKADTL